MKPACLEAVEKALGRALTPGEAEKIEKQVKLHMKLEAVRDPAAWSALSATDRLERGAQGAAQAMLHEVQKKAQRLRLQIAVHDRIENALSDRLEARDESGRPTKPGELLRDVSNILAFDTKGFGFTSIESWAHSLASESMGRLMPLWNSVKGFAGLFENPKGVSDLVHELFGEDSGNADAKAAAKAWLLVNDESRDRGNAAGLDIGKLDEWHYPQSHSQMRVAQAGIAKYLADTLPLLGRSKYLNEDGSGMNDDQVTEILRSVYDTITSDGVNKIDPGAPKGYGSTANRLSQHRAVFYKDAESFLKYQALYGEQNLWTVLTTHVRSVSRDIALAEIAGPNARATFDYFNDRALKQEMALNPTGANKINGAYKFNQTLYDYVAGSREVVNQKIQDVGQAFRNFEVAAKLGQVVLTALGDEATMAATALANKVPWTEVMASELSYMSPGNAADRAVAAHAGLGINGIIGGLNRFGQEDLQLSGAVGSAARARLLTAKLANATLHLSGAEAMWDARRRGLGRILMSYLGKTVQSVEHFADINPQDHGVLANKGISEADWQVWKKAELEDWGVKHGVLTPKSVWNIPDEQLASLGDPRALKRHAATMLLGHILEETGMGVTDTGARERARMSIGTTAGSVGGELVRSGMLFKGFNAAIMMKHWARASAMPTGTDRIAYATRLISASLILGAVANQLRSLAAGQDPQNIAEPAFWGAAALRGGGLGFYGDFVYSELTSHDTSLIPALLGPLATETETIWNLTGAAAFKAARGERTDEGAKALRFLQGNVPLLNMWYTRAAMNHLLWNDLQEAANPGYLDRMQNRAFLQKGTTWWWDPHEGTPSSAPDFGKLWQPELGAEQLNRLKQSTGLD